MNRLVLTPETKDEWLKMRTKDLTSTEISALFKFNGKSASPYATELEIYLNKKSGEIPEFDPNERVEWGIRLEDAIAEGFAADENWTVVKMSEYIRLAENRIGASFDYRIVVGDKESDADGILEIKNVDGLVFRDQWIMDDDGNIEAPLHIELQLQTQMLVSGLKWGYIGALVGGNRGVILRREASPLLQAQIIAKAKAFWDRVDAGQPPDFEFPEDASVLINYLSTVEKGSVIQADTGVTMLAEEYSKLGDQIKELTEMREVVKAQMLVAIGEAEKVIGDGFSITASEVKGTMIESYFRKPYRLVRVNRKKK